MKEQVVIKNKNEESVCKSDDTFSESSSCKYKTCGLIMPISGILDCTQEHWSDVHKILSSAIESEGFQCSLVSDSEDAGIIHERIVKNIYHNPIAVCDVSCKNPNVMFELGMRLAFDKPVVIVKDDRTEYSFDTGIIEHLEYPRDLRHGKIEEFKQTLRKKVRNTYESSKVTGYSAFLKNFSDIKVSKISTEDVDVLSYIAKKQEEMRGDIDKIRIRMQTSPSSMPTRDPDDDWKRLGLVTELRTIAISAASSAGKTARQLDVDAFMMMLPKKYQEAFTPAEVRQIVAPIIEPVPF